jgi:hypothetical protein
MSFLNKEDKLIVVLEWYTKKKWLEKQKPFK